mgnify:CR=1 FL=1
MLLTRWEGLHASNQVGGAAWSGKDCGNFDIYRGLIEDVTRFWGEGKPWFCNLLTLGRHFDPGRMNS